MKVLIVGNGGREHALAWKFSRSKRNSGVYCIPGNAGTVDMAVNIDQVAADDIEGIRRNARELAVDLIFIGPEAPLSMGLADRLREDGFLVVGPGESGARLESSKAYSKDFMNRHGIPTAKFKLFSEAGKLKRYLKKAAYPLVVKKSGLAAGKGVLETAEASRAIEFALSHIDDGEIIVEEYLDGYEISIFAISDGTDYFLLPAAADYKKAGENNTGPNTGGMGVVCPVPWFDTSLMPRIVDEIVDPSFQGLRDAGIDYRGILYFGIMITKDGPKVLEYNVRFGDPEAQTLLPLIEDDFCNLFEAVASGNLGGMHSSISPLQSICAVVASAGYPGDYKKGLEVILPDIRLEQRQYIFHASTVNKDGKLLTGGGRCFAVVGTGTELLKARNRCYELASTIQFEGAWFRKDIGNKIFGSAE